MTRTQPGDQRGGRVYEFYIQYLSEERRDRAVSNLAPTFPKYFVVIVISVAYKLLTSPAHRQSINVKHCSPGTF